MSYEQHCFVDDPLITASAQFPLGKPTIDTKAGSMTRPWGLNGAEPAGETPKQPALRYDHTRQIAVMADGTGRAFVDIAAGPPTAPTTEPTDGEDPPSSEDWINDYTPDFPACPF